MARENQNQDASADTQRASLSGEEREQFDYEYFQQEYDRNPEDLFQRILRTISERDQLQEQTETLQRRAEAMEEQNSELRQELDEVKETLIQVMKNNRGRQDRAGASADKSTKLPDPDALDDGKEPRFEDWLARVKDKLKVNADHFPSEEFRRAYVIGRVTGKAARYIAPRIREDSADPYRSAEDIFQHLATKFDDPNRVFNAKNDFKKLYMRDLPFHDFYADFIHLASEAQVSTTDLKYELNHKLATELQLRVIREFQDPEYTLQKFADYCTVIDQAVKSANARLQGRNKGQNKTTGKDMAENTKDKPKVTENSGPG